MTAPPPWSEGSIARALARQFFERKHLVMVPNCIWTGNECDLLVVTRDLRLIDVEIKISRADLKADAKKDKWWRRLSWYGDVGPPQRRLHPPKIWKHYYALPAEIWKPELLATLVSPASGVLLLTRPRPDSRPDFINVHAERRCTPNKDAEKISPAAAIDIARLASLRMWDSYEAVELAQRKARPAVEGATP